MANTPDYSFEQTAIDNGATYVVGVDEVGRGPVAGPVVAAAVRLNPDEIPDGLNDSKILSRQRRQLIAPLLWQVADVAVAQATVHEVETLNILQASLLAMERAVAALPNAADHILVDGNRTPDGLQSRARSIVKGDALSLSIAAASIVAKVWRDALMVDLAQQHPGYGWERNAGYLTKEHHLALQIHGVTPHHRRSFKPIHNILYQEKSVSR
ncbi:MAG: ribonuclease HII [Paracoccaceae bacterium]